MKRQILLSLTIALALVGCSNQQNPGGNMSYSTQLPTPDVSISLRPTIPTAEEVATLTKLAETNNVRITTNRGTIDLELYPESAPIHVASFLKLIQSGFYNGLTFHRVIPGFVAQGGDPKGDGTGGPGYNLPAEFNSHKHETGTLAMARSSDPNSAGSQFYITLAPQPSLDNQYTVFGQVVSDMDLVQKIQVGDVMTKLEIIAK